MVRAEINENKLHQSQIEAKVNKIELIICKLMVDKYHNFDVEVYND